MFDKRKTTKWLGTIRECAECESDKKESCLNIFEEIGCNAIYDIVVKLSEYENIEPEPEKLKEIDKLYLAKCEEVNRLKAELGQSLKLPCKVGDTVYQIVECNNGSMRIVEMEVCALRAFGSIRFYYEDMIPKIWHVYLKDIYSESYCTLQEFHITVFTSKEEAQAKLEERKGE